MNKLDIGELINSYICKYDFNYPRDSCEYQIDTDEDDY